MVCPVEKFRQVNIKHYRILRETPKVGLSYYFFEDNKSLLVEILLRGMHISLAPEILARIGSFPLTNTLFMVWIILAIFIVLALFLRRRPFRQVPKGLQNIFEVAVEKLLAMVQSVTQDRARAEKFFPLVATIFLFVLFSNLIEIVPGLGTIGLSEEIHGESKIIPFIRSSSADLNLTFAIALTAVVSVQIMGVGVLGIKEYAGKFFVPPWRKPYAIGTFVGLLEFIAEFAKIISFAFRLFGNIFAGEVLLTVILFMVPYLVPLPFLFLEIFVGFIQALVFSMLTLVFLTMATTSHHEEQHAHEKSVTGNR